MTGSELFLVKRVFRSTFAEERGSVQECITLVRTILAETGRERRLLLSMFGPSWRCSFLAFRSSGLHGQKCLLLPALHTAAVRYRESLCRGEEEESDPTASSAGAGALDPPSWLKHTA